MRGCPCWSFPIYTVFLLGFAIYLAIYSSHSHSSNYHSSKNRTSEPHSSEALRRAGFTFMADLLHTARPFFFPPQNSTFFAIKDSAIKNTSLPLWFLKSLLLYHTFTPKASMEDLLNSPQGTCIQTLLAKKTVSITKVGQANNKMVVEINCVMISNPDIYLGDQIAIHGVLGPFSSLQGGLDSIHSTPCPLPNTTNSTSGDSKNVVEWNRVVHLLGSKGYSSFSIALHYVLDGIQKDLVGLGFATIFAPPDLTTTMLGYPSTLLDRAVRLHILPRRFTYGELTSLPVRTRLKTLMPDDHLEIDGVLGFMRGVVINGVEIDAPDMFTSEKFVVHGISRAFKMAALTPS